MKKKRIRPWHWGLISTSMLVAGWTNAATQLDSSIWPTARRDDTVWVSITGEISAADVKALQQIATTPPAAETIVMHLDSGGGSVESAIEIGRILRKHHAFAIVRGKCLSSCVLILAGATHRTVLPAGQVGIHRPYNGSTSEIDFEKRQSMYSETRRRVQSYLEEMNITPRLFDAMQQIPPESIRVLTEAELATFGLKGDDPVEAEAQNARNARLYGISVVEYMQRETESDRRCAQLPFASKEILVCNTAILLAVSQVEAKRRIDRAAKECDDFSDKTQWEQCYSRVLRDK